MPMPSPGSTTILKSLLALMASPGRCLQVLQAVALEDREQLAARALAMRAVHLVRAARIARADALDERRMLLGRVHRLRPQAQGDAPHAVRAVPEVEHRLGEQAVAGEIDQLAMEALVGLGPSLEVVGAERTRHVARGALERRQLPVRGSALREQ